jgi:colanic acid/amylovoran biosynthesis glycosyltransferase
MDLARSEHSRIDSIRGFGPEGHAGSVRPRLFLLTSTFPYGQGETFVANELVYLASGFSQVHILTAHPPDSTARPVPPNVTVDSLNPEAPWPDRLSGAWIAEVFKAFWRHPHCAKVALKSWWISKGYALSLIRCMHRYSSEDEPTPVVYAYWMSEVAMAGIHAGSQITARVFSRAHNWDLYEERHPYHYLPFRAFLAKHLHASFPISEDGERQLVARGFQCVTLARLGVQRMLENPPTEVGEEVVLISISSLTPVKRVDALIEALQDFERGELRWLHFGDGPEAARLQMAGKSLRVAPEWQGHCSNDQLKDRLLALSASAVLINTSSFEGIPVSMMEVMSMGIPCIGSEVGGVSEIIQDNVNGYLMDAEPIVPSIRRSLRRFLATTLEKRLAMKRAAYQTWLSKYDAETNYRH